MPDNDYITELLQDTNLSVAELKAELVKRKREQGLLDRNLDYLKEVDLEKDQQLILQIINEANYVEQDDSRLSDARTPTPHTHTIKDITDLPDYTPAIQAIEEALKGECEATQKQFVAVKKEIESIAKRKIEFPKQKDFTPEIKQIEEKLSEFVNKKEFEALKKEITKDPNIKKLIGGGGYKEVRKADALYPLRHKLNFIGDAVTISDNINTGSTDITITGGGGGGTWGSITGTLSDQTDLQAALDAKLSSSTAASTYVPYSGASGDVTLGTHKLTASALQANSSAGGELRTNSGTVAVSWGAGGGANSTVYGGLKGDYLTASTMLITDASKNIITATTATYPSLTELSYVKGVTSSIQSQINALSGALTYIGTWNASTNTPTLVSSTGTAGHYYVVSVAGSTNLDGITTWNVGDWAIFNGTVWERLENSISTTDDLPEGSINLYFTDERAQDAVGGILTDTATIDFNYNDAAPSITADLKTISGYISAGTNVTFSGAGTVASPFVVSSSGGGGSGDSTTKAITQASHGFSVGQALKFAGGVYALAQADSAANAEVIGIVSAVAGVNDFTLLMEGYVSGLSGLTANTMYFLSASSAGALTATEPSTVGQVSKPLLFAVSTTAGVFNNMRGTVIAAPIGAITSLTGDVTGSGTGAVATTIAANAVDYTKSYNGTQLAIVTSLKYLSCN